MDGQMNKVNTMIKWPGFGSPQLPAAVATRIGRRRVFTEDIGQFKPTCGGRCLTSQASDGYVALSAMLIIAPAVAFTIVVAPVIISDTTIAVPITVCSLALLALVFLAATHFVEPGILPRGCVMSPPLSEPATVPPKPRRNSSNAKLAATKPTQTSVRVSSDPAVFFKLIQLADYASVAACLAAHPSLASERNKIGRTGLHYACYLGNPDVVEALVVHGADQYALDDFHLAPIHYAVSCGHQDVWRYMNSVGFTIQTFEQRLQESIGHAPSQDDSKSEAASTMSSPREFAQASLAHIRAAFEREGNPMDFTDCDDLASMADLRSVETRTTVPMDAESWGSGWGGSSGADGRMHDSAAAAEGTEHLMKSLAAHEVITDDVMLTPPPITPVIQVAKNSTYCAVCHVLPPARSKHCRECNACVVQFDHHCPWVSNCIGARNYKYFVLFITTVTIVSLLTTACCGLALVRLVLSDSDDFVTEVISFITGLISLLGAVPVGGLWYFHMALISSDMTTMELFRSKRKRLPCCIHGFGAALRNFKQVFFSSTPASLCYPPTLDTEPHQPVGEVPSSVHTDMESPRDHNILPPSSP